MFLCVKNADLYAPEHLGKRDILICNDKVIAVKDTIGTLPEGCRVIDAAGRKVIPGLIDQHVHVTGGGGESGFTSRVPEEMNAYGILNHPLFLVLILASVLSMLAGFASEQLQTGVDVASTFQLVGVGACLMAVSRVTQMLTWSRTWLAAVYGLIAYICAALILSWVVVTTAI